MNIKNKLAYYRDCYQEDSGDLNLWNLTKLKKDDYVILQGQDDLGSGFLPRLPLNAEFAAQMQQRVDAYQRERVLLYTSFMLIGKLEIKGEMKAVVTPLVFNEAYIEQEGEDFYFSVENNNTQVNEAVTQLLMPESALTPEYENMNELQSASLWTNWLKDSPLNINSFELLNFPKLVGINEIKQAAKKQALSLLPVSMLVFIERSSNSRGVLHEMEEIIESNKVPAPLSSLFQSNANKKYHKRLKYDYLPGLLSTPQKKVISIAANMPLASISGPPGTGKSYTIAAVAAEHMARGESVLIVANNDAALDVIVEKLDQNFALKDVSIRAGQKAFLKKLKAYIADLLAGYASSDAQINPEKLEQKLNKINRLLLELETKFIGFCQKAIHRGQRLKKLETRDAKFLKKLYLTIATSGIRKLAKHWSALNDINQMQVQRESLAAEYLTALKSRNLQLLIKTQRKSLQAFNQAIRSRTSKRQFELFDDIEYDALLLAFPVWLASLNSLYRVLPLKAEMFDLVIVDEATQCNITSCLPAFYRAKRAVVVGDTKQLRHYSFLSKQKEQNIMRRHQIAPQTPGIISYRDNAILDLVLTTVTSDQQVAFLDEHFRSKPELIYFSNKMFYQNKLKVMQHRPCTSSGHLIIKRVTGVRNKTGINHIEADSVIETTKQLIAADKHAGLVHSIGIISPFRDQADHLAKEIAIHFTQSEVELHNVRAATPFGFQGEERDIMLISFALDNDAKRAAVYLNKPDVFNVSITRARQQQILFLSINEQNLAANNLLKRYLASVNEFKAEHSLSSEIDAFQQDVMTSLLQYNIDTWAGYALAGTEIDILCRLKNKYLAIDLIGFPGPWADFFELNTYKVLKRAGIAVLPVSYGLWTVDKALCIQKIKQELDIT